MVSTSTVAPRSYLLSRRLIVTAVAIWAVAVILEGAHRVTYAERPAFVHVRWAPAVDAPTREELQRQYRLTSGELREGRTWAYLLTDLSTSNIRALVENPAIEDTHEINRRRFRIARTAPRAPYTGPGAQWLPDTLDTLILLLVAVGAIPAALALADVLGLPVQRDPRVAPITAFVVQPGPTVRKVGKHAARWSRERIPAASAESVAAFRIVFGIAVVTFLVMRPVSSAWVTTDGQTTNPISAFRYWATQSVLAGSPVADWLTTWIVFWGVLFVIGLLARTAFVMVTAGAFGWALLYTARIGAHAISALMITLLCLLWSRWGDAWSVDALRRRGRDVLARRAPQEYGYTIWIPGLVLGVTFAAAALAKIREGGLAWILNGTVKYHFLSDSAQAPVDWGLLLGLHPNLAVLLSFAAVAVEALVIVGVCARAYRYRAAAGSAAFALLTGFVLFQGIFWPAWWILLLGFLPWQRIRGRTAAPPAIEPLRHAELLQPRAAHVLMASTIVFQQLIASAFKLEIAPLVSAYDMYSTTYESPEDYERQAGMTYAMVVLLKDGATHTCSINQSDADLLSEIAERETDRDEATRLLERCAGSVARIQSVSVEGRHTAVDWSRWQFAGETRIPLVGPIRWN